MRILIATLAICGAIVAGLALQVHYSSGTTPCSINEKWDCGIVNHSPYAVLGGIPVALIGILGYGILAWLSLSRQRVVLLGFAVAGLLYSLYLSRIERDILEVWCLYCVISLGIIALISLLSLGWVLFGLVPRRKF
jgi:vitamin-K-epoxide reductase (warfarin-sensitive)